MDTSFLTPDGFSRVKQIQDAKDMFETIKRNAEKSGSSVPPYDFIELIGKGAFGRVYKCRHTGTGQLVAVKILNIDDADFEADPRERDETVKDFRKEVEILTQLKDFKAKNVNMIHTAFDLHSQLWIVSDFCTGGSVRTLMRANPKRGLEDRFLIPIARELAIALKSVHDIGVIHRDIKCANVYVTEDGRIQLGDFGVVGVMDNGIAKRTTIIGTPWYMPKEMHVDTFSVTQGYGKEVDIWAFGCTIYEMATGIVPNATVAQHMLGTVLEQQAPRLEGDEYSDDLRDFVAFCLNNDPRLRPSADDILRHSYIAGTKQTHPTQSLVALIDRYIVWEHKGGQRTSLFNPGGAAAPVSSDAARDNPITETDDWNFNTSDSFYGGFAKRYSQMLLGDDFGPTYEAPPGSGLPPVRPNVLSPLERIQREHAAKSESRGARSLDRIWDQDSAGYELNNAVAVPPPAAPMLEPANDLPLREYSEHSAPRESTVFIDLDTTPSDDPGPAFDFNFDDITTVKAKQRGSIVDEQEEERPSSIVADEKRSTMAWTFPSKAPVQSKRATMDWSWPGEPITSTKDTEHDLVLIPEEDELPANFRPQLKHSATAPVGQFGDFLRGGPMHDRSSPSRDSVSSLIDIDLDLEISEDITELERPSTSHSIADSTSTVMTNAPFYLDDDGSGPADPNRFSVHKQWLSEGGNSNRSSLRRVPMHMRGNSLSSTDSEFERASAGRSDFYHDGTMSDFEAGAYLDRSLTLPNGSSDVSTWDFIENDDREHAKPPSVRMGDFTFPRSNGSSNVERNMATPLEAVEFPAPRAPDPAVLFDHADDRLVMSELRRLLRDAKDAFETTATAIEMHAQREFSFAAHTA